MNEQYIKNILESVSQQQISIEDAFLALKNLPYSDLEFAKIDHHRSIRKGYPEVIFCAGKTPDQVREIVQCMLPHGENILATRTNEEMFKEVLKVTNKAEFNVHAKTISIKQKHIEPTNSYIAIVTAGTTDIPVAEEAIVTAELFGNRVEKIYDIGVAGIHRLFDKIEIIRNAKVLIVIAGMEGALPSVVAGLVDKPVIAVPTSIGYGTALNGFTALFAMLTSCSSGIGVVNINNGFGAAYLASLINKL